MSAAATANRPGTSSPTPANGPIAPSRPGAAIGTRVSIPAAMRVVRATAPREVLVTSSEIPLIHPKDPDAKQIQQVLVPRIRVFNLAKPEDVKAAELVWQAIALKRALWSEDKTQFNEATGTFVQYIRWSEIVNALPGQIDEAIAVARTPTDG